MCPKAVLSYSSSQLRYSAATACVGLALSLWHLPCQQMTKDRVLLLGVHDVLGARYFSRQLQLGYPEKA